MHDMKKTSNKPDRRRKAIVTDELLPQLEGVLALSGLSQTSFGYKHFGDPTFFAKLRKGRRLHKLRPAALALIEEYGV